MKKYKVINIIEQDFGCEECPDSYVYCVDVIISDNENNKKITLSIPDKELYEKNINIGSLVYYENNTLLKV